MIAGQAAANVGLVSSEEVARNPASGKRCWGRKRWTRLAFPSARGGGGVAS